MKKIGILGGMGSESTILYYKNLIDSYRIRTQQKSYPQIVINSIDLNLVLDFLTRNDLKGMTTFLSKQIDLLKKSGVDVIAIASNTPHIVFNELKSLTDCPIISIVESTATEAENLNLKKLGLLGTKFTMQSSFFQDVFLEKNIEIFTPTIDEQEYIINKYSTELVHGIANECTQVRFKEIIKNMIIRHNLDGIIIGCTEFPLVIKKSDYPKIQVLDTLEIHVDSILDFVLDEK